MANSGNSTNDAGILKLAAPLVVSFWMRSLFSFVDTAYAATIGDAAVAAVGLSAPFEFLMIACWVGVSTGLTSTLSRALGAGEGARVEQMVGVARRIVWVLVPLFLAIGAGGYLLAPHLGLEPRTARAFAVYNTVLVMGSAVTSFWSIIPDSIVKAHHDTRSTMWAGIWSNLINIGLNTIFTFVFQWGVFGIALSTVVGRFGGLAYALRRASALEAARKAAGSDTNPALDERPYGAILSLAVPSAATYALMALESSIINGLLASMEEATEAIAAYGIYFRVMILSVMPIIATSVAMLPYVARRFGRRDLSGIRRGLREASLASAAYCLLVVAPGLMLGGPFIADALAESPVTAEFAVSALWVCPFACMAAIPFFLVRPAFEGMQRGTPGLLMALLRYIVLTGPMAWAGTRAAGAAGIPEFTGLVVGLIVATGITSAAFGAWFQSCLYRLEQGAGRSSLPVTPSSGS